MGLDASIDKGKDQVAQHDAVHVVLNILIVIVEVDQLQVGVELLQDPCTYECLLSTLLVYWL